jgi:hypothetical protein
MSESSEQHPSAPPSGPAPPPAQMVAPPVRQTVWPMVIGIIAIILGALGALGGCMGVAFTPFLGMVEKLVPPGQAPQLEGMAEMVPALMVTAFAGLVVAVLLLIAGSGLVARRPWAMTACLAWAAVKMVFVVVNAFIGYQINQAQFEAIQSDPNVPAFMSAFFPAMGAFGSCVGIAWGWIFPIFMLIWFARPKIRREVRAWRAA